MSVWMSYWVVLSVYECVNVYMSVYVEVCAFVSVCVSVCVCEFLSMLWRPEEGIGFFGARGGCELVGMGARDWTCVLGRNSAPS